MRPNGMHASGVLDVERETPFDASRMILGCFRGDDGRGLAR
jgi:hypothetical protein